MNAAAQGQDGKHGTVFPNYPHNSQKNWTHMVFWTLYILQPDSNQTLFSVYSRFSNLAFPPPSCTASGSQHLWRAQSQRIAWAQHQPLATGTTSNQCHRLVKICPHRADKISCIEHIMFICIIETEYINFVFKSYIQNKYMYTFKCVYALILCTSSQVNKVE